MQEDLALDTGTPRFQVYLSYAVADWDQVRKISDRLAQLGITAFDERDITMGKVELSEREMGMQNSATLAVLLGPGEADSVALAEADEVVEKASRSGKPAFAVYLPGYDARRQLPQWLKSRKPANLSAGFSEDSATHLAELVAGVFAWTPREAEKWVRDQIGGGGPDPGQPEPQPGVLRALVIGVSAYDHYDPLESTVEADLGVVGELLGADTDSRPWKLTWLTPTARDDLHDEAERFFSSAGVDDTVLFYFSGHGAMDGDEPQLVVSRTQPKDLYRSAFAVSQLARFVRDSPAKQRIVVLDCCFAGEAADETYNWGQGSAVLASSRRWVPVTGSTSELTAAITTAWRAGPATVGELYDALGPIDVHTNRNFARELVLPRPIGLPVEPLAAPKPAVRLTVDHAGELHVAVSTATLSVRSGPLAASLEGRRALVKNLLGMVDAVIAYAPPEGALIKQVTAALKDLGGDLLCSMLPAQVREALDYHIEPWTELPLEISFDDAWAERDWWERLLWESLSLCQDKGRPVTVERIVPAAAVKGDSGGPGPRRVIVWNALPTPTVRRDGSDQPEPLMGYLLDHSLESAHIERTLLSDRTSTWQTLFGASRQNEIPTGPGTSVPLAAFDTFVLFAELSLQGGEPQVWLRRSSDQDPTPVTARSLFDNLEKWKGCSRVVIETVASDRRNGCLEATTTLATRMSRRLGIPVVGVCHSPQYAATVKDMADGEGYLPSFAGELLAALAEPGVSVVEAARRAREYVADGVGFPQSVHVGLPVVCRPERSAPSRPAKAPLVGGPRKKAAGDE